MWSPSNPPIRGGSYSRFIIRRNATLPKSTRGVVALPIVHDWGPVNTFVEVTDLPGFIDVFGQGGDPTTFTYTPGFLAVYNAFKGAGASDPGASRLILYRMANAGVQASVTISNVTPVPALRVRGIYQGTQGNQIGWGVEVNAVIGGGTTHHDFVVYRGTTEVERYAYPKTDLAGLALLVNRLPGLGGSDWITMDGPSGGAIVTGVALTPSARALLTGGADGIAGLIGTDWTAMRTAYEAKQFEVFVPYDLTDTTIGTAMAGWAALKNEPAGTTRSKRFTYVEGGPSNDTITTALLRATTHNSPNVVNLGIGTYRDNVLNTVMSTSQLAPRLAGVIARRGYGSSIFCTHLDDLDVVTGASDSDVLSGTSGGVVTLGLDSVGVRFESQVTSYINDVPDKPKNVYGTIKYVFTMQAFETRVRNSQEGGGLLGRLNVNDDTRETVIADARVILDEFITAGAVQPGAQVVIAQEPPPDDSQDFIGLDWTADFQKTFMQARNTFYLS